MSSLAGKAPGEGRRATIGKAFKRMRLRMQVGKKNKETSSTEPSINEEPATADDEPDRAELAEASKSSVPTTSGSSVYMHRVDPQERARRLFAKYGLAIEEQEWISPADGTVVQPRVLRVEKPIRMRVRYTCHLCQCMLGVERHCRKCSHRRCDQCPRSPPRKNRLKADASKEHMSKVDSDSEMETGSPSRKRGNPEVLRSSRQRTGGKNKAVIDGSQPVLQQAQRYCHKCHAEFDHMAQLCNSCGHLRCPRCPRAHTNWSLSLARKESPRPERVYREPRQRVRWICDHCTTTFTEGSRVCGECLHKRCEECSRIPPKRAHHEDMIPHAPGIGSTS